MGGMLLLNKSLPEAAVKLLHEMPAISSAVHLDCGDLMTWGMEGIAEVCHLAGHEVRHSVQAAIEENFMGAGEAFSAVCSRLETKPTESPQ
ncbi:MAG: hypothetical protein HY077_10275 [Elusimicrobia bacterium]|nr:hypothetical protein [Elusimicrobiota bacterium]